MKKIKTSLLMAGLVLCSSAGMTGCGLELTLSSDSQLVKPGDSIQLSTNAKGKKVDAGDVDYSIVSGIEWATLSEDGLLTVKNTATPDSVIKVQSNYEKTKSNVLEITVDKITATSFGLQNLPSQVMPGQVVVLETFVYPENSTDKNNINIVFTQNEDLITRESSTSKMFVVKNTAAIGSVIKVKATIGNRETPEYSITVVENTNLKPATAVTLTASADTAQPGETITLTPVVTPADTTDKTTFVFTQNESMITRESTTSKMFTIKNTATIGAVIKVKAVVGGVESQEVSITVAEATTVSRQISVSNSITIDAKDNDANQNILEATLLDGNANPDTTTELSCRIVEGGSLVSVQETTPNTFVFTALGHGDAVAEVYAPDRTSITPVRVNVKVLVAPEAITMPEYLAQFKTLNESKQQTQNYQVGVSTASVKQYVPFGIGFTKGSSYTGGVCEDVKVEFKREGEQNFTSNHASAQYDAANGLYFTQTGKYNVKVTANSGSDADTNSANTFEFTFDVNEHKNVYNFTEFKTALESRQSVNVIVSEKPVYTVGGQASTYDLVPEFLLNRTGEETEAILWERANAAAIDVNLNTSYNSIVINGNDHKIDLSTMPIITNAFSNGSQGEFNPFLVIDPDYLVDQDNKITETFADGPTYDLKNPDGTNPTTGGTAAVLDQTKYSVAINNLIIKGSCGVSDVDTNKDGKIDDNYALSGAQYAAGYYSRGIQIGKDRQLKKLVVKMDEVDVSGFSIGMRLSGLRSVGEDKSELNNITIHNNFKAGMELAGNEMTIQNSTFGLSGQGAIELGLESFWYAGPNYNANQTVKLVNVDLSEDAISTYETPFFNYYATNAVGSDSTVLQIIAGAVTQYITGVQEATASYGSETQTQIVTAVKTNLFKMMFGSAITDSEFVNSEVGFIALSLNAGGFTNGSTLVPDDSVFNAFISDPTIVQQTYMNPEFLANMPQKYIRLDLGNTGSVYLLNRYAESLPQA